jgi:hypothetical protein
LQGASALLFMPKPKAKYEVIEVPPLKKDNMVLSSAWEGERLLDGFASIGRTEAELSKAQDNPLDRPRQFMKAREHWRHQWFVREITRLRFSFYHYGFKIVSEEKKARKAVKDWAKSNRRMYRKYAREAWLEWLVMDNVVGIWRVKGIKPPVVFPPECCHFSDLWGNEILKMRHQMTTEHITTIGAFSRTEQAAFASSKVAGELTLEHGGNVFDFDVLRRERTGAGFGVPTVADIFLPAAEATSLDAGLQTLSGACRYVMEQHLMGHEIKSGIHAGSPAHFYNKKRAEAFEKQTKGKTGHNRVATNFDHLVRQAANWPDPKHFQDVRYSSAMMRFAVWSMPLGQMLFGKTLNPFLMTMLKVQAQAEREFMEEHLRTVFVQALGAPEETKVAWSNACFTDPRIAADMMKTGLAAGPTSQTTFQREAGMDPEEERENKSEESKLPEAETHPIYDAAHGPDKLKGRKSGSRDGDKT